MSIGSFGLPRLAGVLVWVLFAGLAVPVAAQQSQRQNGRTGAKRQASAQAANRAAKQQQAARAANARKNQPQTNRTRPAVRRNPNVAQRRVVPNAGAIRQQAALAGQTTGTRALGRDGAATTASMAAAAMRGGAATSSPLQLMLQGMDPAERRATMEYVRGLDQEARRTLIREMQSLPEGERAGWLSRRAHGEPAPPSSASPKSPQPTATVDRPTSVSAVTAPAVAPAPPAGPATAQPGTFFRMSGLGVGVPLPTEGKPAPEFRLTDPDGKVIASADLRGHTVVLQFGSVTSPVYRGTVAAMNDVRGRAPKDTVFVLAYTQEAHPKGEKSPYSDQEWIPLKNQEEDVLLPQTRTLEERLANARRAAATLGEQRVVGVDGMDNAAWRAFGGRANSVFVIGPDGVLNAAWEYPDPAALAGYLKDPRLRLALR